MSSIYKKDMHSYFTTFTGYVFVACVLLVGGIYCYIYNLYYRYASFETAISNLSFFFIFLIPVIASGVFTEEKKQKTEQLLYTLPLKSSEIVLGKYFALVTVIAIPMAILGIYPIILSAFGEVNFAAGYANLLAMFLLASTLAAICMFISSLLGNMIVSAVVCFAVLYLLSQMSALSNSVSTSGKASFIGFVIIAVLIGVFVWFMTKNIYIAIIPTVALTIVFRLLYVLKLQLIAGKINLVLSSLAIFSRLDTFMNGIFDISAIVYYLAISIMFVFLTIYTFERRRWI